MKRVLFFILLLPFAGNAQKIMTSSFENNLLDSVEFYEGCCAHTQKKTTYRKYQGNYSVRGEIRKGDPQVKTGSNRWELNINSTNNLKDRFEWRWWRFSTYIPSDSNAVDQPGLNYIMGQAKQPNKGGVQTGYSPPLGFVVDGDSVFLWIRWATASEPHSDNPSNTRKHYVGRRGVDSFIHYVVDYQRSHLANGVVRVWRNDILVVHDTGRNYFEGAGIPSIKFGLYCYNWVSPRSHHSIVPYRVLYLDAIGVFGAFSTYEEVAVYRQKGRRISGKQ